MSYAIRFEKPGDTSVLRYEEWPLDDPAAHEIQIEHRAIGLNFIDIYHRSGLYPLPLPSGLGMEGAGVVIAVGREVADFAVGDRVAYAGGPVGAYAERRNFPANQAVKLPKSCDFATAAAVMLQGLTAQYLLRRTYRVKAGDTVLIHAAAGGVGLLMCQWAKHLGATVIGTVGDEQKMRLAEQHGCDYPINYRQTDFAQRVADITHGAGVQVVYDSIGKDTWQQSLNCLKPLGLMVSFGNASGPVPPIELGELAQKGSLFLTRPILFHYTAKRAELLSMASELFAVLENNAVQVLINQKYALKDAALAHQDLENRRTVGASILLP